MTHRTDAGETWALLEEFERAYPESIMIIHLEENLRQGGARNVALGYATGEYLAFVDADDFVEKDFLEKVYRRAVESEADIVQFDYVYYTERLGKVASGRTTADESIQIQTKEERKAFPYQREDHLRLLEQAVPEIACGAGGRPLCRACHL